MPSEAYGIMHGVDLLFDRGKVMPPFVPTPSKDQLVMYENSIQEPYYHTYSNHPNVNHIDHQQIYRTKSLELSPSYPNLLRFKKEDSYGKCNSSSKITAKN